jgi:hypothetical protein
MARGGAEGQRGIISLTSRPLRGRPREIRTKLRCANAAVTTLLTHEPPPLRGTIFFLFFFLIRFFELAVDL